MTIDANSCCRRSLNEVQLFLEFVFLRSSGFVVAISPSYIFSCHTDIAFGFKCTFDIVYFAVDELLVCWHRGSFAEHSSLPLQFRHHTLPVQQYLFHITSNF